MDKSIKHILISASQIKQRVKELGVRLSADYKDKNVVIICVLKGAVVFLADLIRALSIPVELDFVRLSSYGKNIESSGVVQIVQNITSDIQHKDVLIVEDIVDTGTTLNFLKECLLSQKPSSLKICTFLDKPARREKSITIEYIGFEIPNCFVVGYGLDYNEKYRNLPYIAAYRTPPQNLALIGRGCSGVNYFHLNGENNLILTPLPLKKLHFFLDKAYIK